jgi:hypothetical protein
MICQIEGCNKTTSDWFFCDRHWKQIPLKLRVEFWTRTDYGKIKPEPGLLARINATIKNRPPR